MPLTLSIRNCRENKARRTRPHGCCDSRWDVSMYPCAVTPKSPLRTLLSAINVARCASKRGRPPRSCSSCLAACAVTEGSKADCNHLSITPFPVLSIAAKVVSIALRKARKPPAFCGMVGSLRSLSSLDLYTSSSFS